MYTESDPALGLVLGLGPETSSRMTAPIHMYVHVSAKFMFAILLGALYHHEKYMYHAAPYTAESHSLLSTT